MCSHSEFPIMAVNAQNLPYPKLIKAGHNQFSKCGGFKMVPNDVSTDFVQQTQSVSSRLKFLL